MQTMPVRVNKATINERDAKDVKVFSFEIVSNRNELNDYHLLKSEDRTSPFGSGRGCWRESHYSRLLLGTNKYKICVIYCSYDILVEIFTFYHVFEAVRTYSPSAE
jgi:hypothetical protein